MVAFLYGCLQSFLSLSILQVFLSAIPEVILRTLQEPRWDLLLLNNCKEEGIGLTGSINFLIGLPIFSALIRKNGKKLPARATIIEPKELNLLKKFLILLKSVLMTSWIKLINAVTVL